MFGGQSYRNPPAAAAPTYQLVEWAQEARALPPGAVAVTHRRVLRLLPLACLAFVAALTVVHLLSPPARAWVWKAQLALGVALALSGAWLGLVWAPPDRYMGEVQRILYVHVPLAWMGLFALTLNFGASLVYLVRQSRAADALAEATAEVGVVFGLAGLAVGALWGRPTWGVWWSWDPRMTATVAMLALYSVYLGVRLAVRDAEKRATASAAVACLIAVVLPVVWMSVRWWSSLHQLQSSPATMAPQMVLVLGWNAAAFLCIFFVLAFHRYRIVRP
jgi:heme exporter protein C